MATRDTIDTARAARIFHALSDETRLGILDCLRTCERCVCELTDHLDAAQSRLSFHLRVLGSSYWMNQQQSNLAATRRCYVEKVDPLEI